MAFCHNQSAVAIMYGKIFERMYDGTLYGQWEAIVTMQQLNERLGQFS